ncbi:MAG TPA: hypothetical protein VFV35_08150 [Acidimicrobiales bacterium]|nr:hypothetical protein [Acidimicrobiales bacterium]
MNDITGRLLSRDASLWPDGNVSPARLGWIDSHRRYRGEAEDLRQWATEVSASKVVLLGMGGSSLGPEVLRALSGSDRLTVLDTTDPRTVASTDLQDAFVVVSSKSGGTLEVQALLAHAWSALGEDGSRFAAITDPGTGLAALARRRGFSRVFENDPSIGGRYSALSYFGLVPAALLGFDVAELCARADAVDVDEAVAFGRAMGEAALEGRDKLTVRTEPASAAFGLWVEQLVAESTGKQSRGCIPVPTTDDEGGPDRFSVPVSIDDAHDLGAEFYRWEIATAVAGHVLGVDPFDEPNVTESKENTTRVLSELPLPDLERADPAKALAALADLVTPGDYVSIQAFLPYDQSDGLTSLRRRVRDALGGMAVTAGFGPRFLHSTGQLHKGGPNALVALQLVPARPTARLAIPGFDYDFATLIAAQAEGDARSLLAHGRRLVRVAVDHVGEVG